MKVLVTGATGFVGSHTAAALLDAGYDVRVLVRDPARLDAAPTLRGRDIEALQGDVVDPDSVRAAVAGCDAVVHAAAMVALDSRRAEQTHEVNVEGTSNVIGAALEAGVERVLYVSTVSLFGVGHRTVTVDSPLAAARGPYALSKLAAEQWVRERQREGAPIVSIYPSGVHGPDSPTLTEGHKATVFWLRYPPSTEGGTSVLDVRDLARAGARLLDIDPLPRRLMMGGHYLTWGRLTRVLSDVTARRSITIPMPGPFLRFAGKVGDVAADLFGLETIWSTESMEMATRAPRYDSSLTLDLFGSYWFRPPEETLADEVRWLADAGHVPAKFAGVLAEQS